MRIEVEPEGYASAAEPLSQAHQSTDSALSDLVGGLSGTGSMAGKDSGGRAFAAQYDPAAAATVKAVAQLGGACTTLGNLVRQAAHNHAAADARSNPRGAVEPQGPHMEPVETRSPYIPSADGGTGDEPNWWHYVLDHVAGAVWPDADTRALRSASHTWYLLAEGLDGVGQQLDSAATMIWVQDSPEVDQAVAAARHLKKISSSLGAQCRSLGKVCNGYAQSVDDAHSHSIHVMEECLAALAVTAVVGIGLTLVTFGGSDAAAAAAADAEVAAAAGEVATTLETCAAAAETGATTVGEVTTVAGEAEAELAPFEAAEPEIAELSDAEEAVTDVAARRPGLRTGTKQAIQDAARKTPDGDFIDPNTGEIVPREGPFHYGHNPGYEWWRTQQIAREEGWTRQEVIEYENDPSHFQIEDPASNMSHTYEMPR